MVCGHRTGRVTDGEVVTMGYVPQQLSETPTRWFGEVNKLQEPQMEEERSARRFRVSDPVTVRVSS